MKKNKLKNENDFEFKDLIAMPFYLTAIVLLIIAVKIGGAWMSFNTDQLIEEQYNS